MKTVTQKFTDIAALTLHNLIGYVRMEYNGKLGQWHRVEDGKLLKPIKPRGGFFDHNCKFIFYNNEKKRLFVVEDVFIGKYYYDFEAVRVYSGPNGLTTKFIMSNTEK